MTIADKHKLSMGISVGTIAVLLPLIGAILSYAYKVKSQWDWTYDQVHELRDRTWCLENPHAQWSQRYREEHHIEHEADR